MDNSDIEKKPKQSGWDVAHALTKAGISGIPAIGGPAAEIFSLIIVPPLTKRRDKWIESIAEGLRKLEEEKEGFKIEELSKNDTFITTVAHATQAAIRNHETEKLEALRNAVLNAALPSSVEEDIQLMFVSFIDELRPWHLRVLKFFENPREWGQKHGITYPTWPMGSPSQALEYTFSELRGKQELYDIYVKDLFSRGLINTDSLHVSMSEQGIFASRTTDTGSQFISFITSPLQTK